MVLIPPRPNQARLWEERGEAGRARPEGVLPTEVAIGIAPCDPPEGPVSADCVGNTPFPSRRQPGKKSSRGEFRARFSQAASCSVGRGRVGRW